MHVTIRYYSTILSISNRQVLVGFERIIRMKELILNYTCTGRNKRYVPNHVESSKFPMSLVNEKNKRTIAHRHLIIITG